MKLSERELRILNIAQYDADLPLSQIARLSAVKEYTVRRLIDRLKDEKAISRLVYVNCYPLGFAEYIVYASISNPLGEIRKLLGRKIGHLKRASWIVELGGSFHFAFGIIARNGQDAMEHFDSIAQQLNLKIIEKNWVERSNWTYYGVRHLAGTASNFYAFQMGGRSSNAEIDELDHNILKHFCASDDGNLSYISRNLNESQSTVQHRLKRMRERGILLGTAYRINSEVFNKQCYRILVFARQLNFEVRKRFLSWAEQEPALLTIVQNVGSWDFELRIETTSGRAANDIATSLAAKFDSHISKLEIMPEFQYFKLDNYPLDASALF